jgi:hypothetical protein
MTVWFVFAVPFVVMLFALFMERVENRLRHVAVQEDEVEEFLESARPDEVRALYGHGIGRALELFRLRRRGKPRGRRMVDPMNQPTVRIRRPTR